MKKQTAVAISAVRMFLRARRRSMAAGSLVQSLTSATIAANSSAR